jgi:hypothetical protein
VDPTGLFRVSVTVQGRSRKQETLGSGKHATAPRYADFHSREGADGDDGGGGGDIGRRNGAV